MFQGVLFSNPTGDATLRVVGKDDIRKYLELTAAETEKLANIGINFDYWFEGDHITGKKWTFDGDDVYNDLSIKNFLLASICDMYKGAKILKNKHITEKIESIEGLKKWLHFGNTRITIKEMYYGIYKNFWSF